MLKARKKIEKKRYIVLLNKYGVCEVYGGTLFVRVIPKLRGSSFLRHEDKIFSVFTRIYGGEKSGA